MNSFRYQALQTGGTAVEGVIEAEDRKSALQLLGQRGLFPSNLEACSTSNAATSSTPTTKSAGFSFSQRIGRKEITAFTREMSALLGAAIPIPQALESLGEEEENLTLRAVVLQISEAVRKGESFSASLGAHPQLFSTLYVSMIRVGEEAGLLPGVMNDLANLLEHEDEVRDEVKSAVAYPLFVLGFGIVTVTILLGFVLPRLFGMMQEMLPVLPLPTLILLKVSGALHQHWLMITVTLGGTVGGLWWYVKTRGAEAWDKIKLRIPVMGAVFQSAALGRFARTLGTLVKSGVSLLPALRIVEDTIGNRIMAAQIAQVAEETRGGDSLAAPLRKLRIFPKTVVQMISVGEESGQLDQMLLKVADIEERHMRSKIKILISWIAPIMIVAIGSIIGFIVIAILLPIFKMSSTLH